ncbi:MAG: hypothetical protein GY758_18935 [Fuerstiella sp.]|nr:hypothetical protein [Fuerstiella sp.]MCP4508760.1 hypothetical protein [Fuerstiella sp.]
MAAHYLIIDGYNLMHAAGIARRSYGQGDLERCRNQLNRLLLDLLGRETLSRTSVVYDAFESTSDENRSQDHGGLHVLFAPKGTDADTEIERLLTRHSSPKQVLVVSGDHRLHRAARRRKASCVDSEDFLAGIQSPGTADNRTLSQPLPAKTVLQKEAEEHLQSWAEEIESRENQAGPKSGDRAFTEEYLHDLQREVDDETLP